MQANLHRCPQNCHGETTNNGQQVEDSTQRLRCFDNLSRLQDRLSGHREELYKQTAEPKLQQTLLPLLGIWPPENNAWNM
jgi:hypothetical protein